jgi:NADH-quinone oxidoreductase subunit H
MSDPFGQIGQFLLNLLIGWGLEAGLAAFLLKLVGAAALGIGALFSTFLLIWGERKLLARLQDRLGPNRLGPFGILQTVGDFAKLVTKEIIIPSGADKVVFLLAPMLVVMSVVGAWAVIPFAPGFIGTDINVGVLYIVSVGGIGILGIMLAGWASNNKYSLLGAFRAVAQLVSYEVPMVLVLLIPVMLTGSMGLGAIVEAQSPIPYVVLAPLAALLFYISSLAENGRAPFDLMEAESEIATGFNIEYTALMFGMFFVAEFLHAFAVSALMATLFLGGWRGPGAEAYPLLGLVYFFIKTSIVWFSIIWVRMSLPRVRIDQMLALNWKLLTPVALSVVVVTAVAEKLAPAAPLGRALVLLGANGLVLVIAVLGLAAYGRTRRERPVFGPAATGAPDSPSIQASAR